MRINRENGNNLWRSEMKNSRIAFELLPRDERLPVGFKEITCHLVFDIKMDLTRKTRYVAAGCLMDQPSSIAYTSTTSRDSVKIAFLAASLNGLKVLEGDI